MRLFYFNPIFLVWTYVNAIYTLLLILPDILFDISQHSSYDRYRSPQPKNGDIEPTPWNQPETSLLVNAYAPLSCNGMHGLVIHCSDLRLSQTNKQL